MTADRDRGMADRVDAPVKAMESPGIQAVPDRLRAEAQLHKLGVSDHAMLALRQ
jgi:hypothetical protein